MPVFTFSSDNYPKMALERWDSDVEENIMLRNNTTFIRGKHNLKVGIEVRQQWWKPRRWRNQAGTFRFSFRETALNASSNTGNSFASFLLGYVDTANISTPLHVASSRPYYAGYVQDDIKLTSEADFEPRAAVRPRPSSLRAVRSGIDVRSRRAESRRRQQARRTRVSRRRTRPLRFPHV